MIPKDCRRLAEVEPPTAVVSKDAELTRAWSTVYFLS